MRITLGPAVRPSSAVSASFLPSWSRAEMCLGLFLVMLLLIAVLAPPVVLPDHYHQFIDSRAWWGIPNAMDVLSNGAFAAVGAWCISRLSHADRRAIAQTPVLYAAALIVGMGLWFTSVGSGIFHWQPNTAGLALDRMAMSVIFAGLLGMAVAHHISERAGLVTMVLVLTLAPVAAAVAWFTDNATPWGVVQYGGMALLLALALVGVRSSRMALVKVLLIYVVAKMLEMGDEAIWHITNGLVSGHPLKHLVAAVAVIPMWQMLVYGDAPCKQGLR